jgi:hypothetical protein
MAAGKLHGGYQSAAAYELTNSSVHVELVQTLLMGDTRVENPSMSAEPAPVSCPC